MLLKELNESDARRAGRWGRLALTIWLLSAFPLLFEALTSSPGPHDEISGFAAGVRGLLGAAALVVGSLISAPMALAARHLAPRQRAATVALVLSGGSLVLLALVIGYHVLGD